jgi:hypothetical protein
MDTEQGFSNFRCPFLKSLESVCLLAWGVGSTRKDVFDRRRTQLLMRKVHNEQYSPTFKKLFRIFTILIYLKRASNNMAESRRVPESRGRITRKLMEPQRRCIGCARKLEYEAPRPPDVQDAFSLPTYVYFTKRFDYRADQVEFWAVSDFDLRPLTGCLFVSGGPPQANF